MVTARSSSRALLGLAATSALACALACRPARADEARPDGAPASSASPAAPSFHHVHHAPVSSARAHEDLRITVTLEHPELVRAAAVVYRTASGELKQALLLRSDKDPGYVAVVPGGDVRAPGLAYAIEIERLDGKRAAAFATRADMQPVIVLDDRTDVREKAALERLDGRRSVVAASGDYVGFGTTTGAAIPCASGQPSCPAGQLRVPSVQDQYWRVEIGYTYRPLRTVAEFGIKLGVVRGTSLVQQTELDTSAFSVGLNYAEPWLRFRLADAWHVELAALASISEVGFSIGGGTALLIGDPYGTRLTLGAETIGFGSTYFGSRFYTKLDLLVREGMTVGPAVEVTNMPHAETYGVRLYGDTSFTLPRGFGLGVRAGYEARLSTSGGAAAGGTVSYAF
jgi:hypothetical protein